MKTVERHKKTDFGDVWYVNAADGTYRFAVYKYDDDDDTIYLSNVFVKEDSRGHGYGNEILAAAEDYANRLGASVICLKVLSGSDVHRWYKRHGYEDLEKDEEERGYMWMKKELKKIDESHWSEMNRRSQGTAVRKEDDLDIHYKNLISGHIIDSFSENLVYIETTINNIYSFKRFAKDLLTHYIENDEVSEEAIDLYIDRHWNEFSKTINEKVQEEKDYVKSTGFQKYMFSSIKTSFDDWWKKLDENDKEDLVYYYNQTAEEMDYETYKDADEFYRWANMREKLYGWKCLKMNESHWSEMNRRSQGLTKRIEDGQKEKDIVETHCLYFARQIVYEDAYKNDLNDFIEHFHNAWKYMTGGEKYVNAVVNYIKPRWKMFKALIDEHVEKLEKKVESQGFKKVPGESISETLNKWWDSYEYKDDELEATNNDLDTNEKYRDANEMWDDWDYDQKIECYMNDMEQTNECDGVPGGLTPVDVGGMGPAYFPGPHGEPGSGDLPCPTGKVYQQVAPFAGFIKRKKSKKKKKFRKEDEPCVHSPNAKVYDYVDDYREYVDRTYNNVDKRK